MARRAARGDRHLYVALLAGGRGTRFWPLSRRRRPKQLLDVTGDGPLLALAAARARRLCPPENVLLVTTTDLATASQAVLRLPARNVLAEPSGRNTAPAVGLAALVAQARDPRAVVLAMPADHAVRNERGFDAALRRGVAAARSAEGIVLFGAVPDRPETAYGYIVPAAARGKAPWRVGRFREKPDAAGARRLVRAGALWNMGLFAFDAGAALQEIARSLPDLARELAALRPHVDRPTFARALARHHRRMPAISFDHGVLEHARRLAVVPTDVGWSDVGTWESLARFLPADDAQNAHRAHALLHGASRCLVVQADAAARRRLLVLADVEGLVVVDAGDALLVTRRGSTGDAAALLRAVRRLSPSLL